ncbi:cytokinin dehydrogenase 3-like [Macadamia integrifolia]|uniref:cytokinin dehydrogenase 3-like n=1 Tax=Macadamia integrifolia TaxID=60698 RepID=UPI001C4ED2BF|nr:cytokinin dehydrogenase 3-like [Macadamia integrifolia]
MDSIPLQFYSPTPSETLDFGRIIQQSPSFVLEPSTPEEISLLLKSISLSPSYNNITVAARGAGHSIHGQAQAPDGIVIDITSLPTFVKISKCEEAGSESKYHNFFIDVSGGALWVDVLKETLKHGLTPRSWTDYLFLTVGGTLSVGGISGQTFKYGPQICNVLEMDVITGKGDFVTCSKERNPELFYGVLGGLGQFGIIIRARIILEIAPKMVKHVRLFYSDFNLFTRDQENLISMKEVDYVEGFIKLSHCEPLDHLQSKPETRNAGSAPVDYIIEVALYYNEEAVVQEVMEQVLSQLSVIPWTRAQIDDISYFNFLNRVKQEEKKLRNRGLWEVPHPWLNVFIPKSHIKPFKNLLLKTISSIPPNGPVLIYPVLRHKWEKKMSVVLPREEEGEDVFYIVSLLRSAIPSSSLQTLLSQNQEIIDAVTSKAPIHLQETINVEGEGGQRFDHDMGGKQYMPYLRDESEWRIHFGEEWKRFEALKFKFDPFNILAPGQMIFRRKNIEI